MTEPNSAPAKEVWITGIGIVSSLGEGLDAHWDALNARTINVDDKRFAPYIVHPLAPVSFNTQIPKKGDQRQMETWQRLGTYAAGLALDGAASEATRTRSCTTMDMVIAAAGGERDEAVEFGHPGRVDAARRSRHPYSTRNSRPNCVRPCSWRSCPTCSPAISRSSTR